MIVLLSAGLRTMVLFSNLEGHEKVQVEPTLLSFEHLTLPPLSREGNDLQLCFRSIINSS